MLGAKLAALARDLDDVEVQPRPLGVTSTALADDTNYMLQEQVSPASLGAAMLHTLRSGCRRLVLFVDGGGPVAARLAGFFSAEPAIEIRSVVGASSAPAQREPPPVVLPGPDAAAPLIGELADRGLEVVLEEGVWRAELLGLEVARIVRWPEETGGDGELHIEAGVGRFDRDATAAMHGGESAAEALDRVLSVVSAQRYEGAAGHPLCRLARSRWLRSSAMVHPGSVGADSLSPIESTFVADSVREERPAAALGTTTDGEAVVTVFGAGVPLELVPIGLDVRELHAPGALLRLVVPPRDQLTVTEQLARAAEPALGEVELVDLDPPWAS